MICVYTFHQRKKERNKQTKWHVRPGKTQISLGIRPVWSKVFAVRMKKAWVLTYPLSAHRRLWSDWADAGRNFVGLVMRRLIYFRRTFAFKLKCSCWKKKCRCVDIFCEIAPKYLNVIIQIYQFCPPTINFPSLKYRVRDSNLPIDR